MDEETRSAIDSLISGTKKRSRTHPSFKDTLREPDPRPKWAPDPFERFVEREREHERERGILREKEREIAREEALRWARKGMAEASKVTAVPTFCYGEKERGLINLKLETATLSVDTSSASIIFKGPLNDKLIKRIENAVPVTQREWMESKKAWRFSPACLAILKPILKDEYKDVQMLGVPKALPSTKFDQLMSKLSKDDKAAVYKLLASRHHPDKGGSHEVMTLINVVFRG